MVWQSPRPRIQFTHGGPIHVMLATITSRVSILDTNNKQNINPLLNFQPILGRIHDSRVVRNYRLFVEFLTIFRTHT